MPPRDAHLLEEMVIELPPVHGNQDDEMDVVKSDDALPQGDDALPQADDGGEGEEDMGGPWDMKMGTATFEDLGVNVGLIIMNYGLLRSKADMYSFMLKPFSEMLAHVKEFEEAIEPLFESCIESFPDDCEDNLVTDIRQATYSLVFAMVDAGRDPHDIILNMLPTRHGQIYQAGCVHCDPSIDYADELDPPETMKRLEEVLHEIGFEEHVVGSLTVEQAQLELMGLHGELEDFYARPNMNDFHDAHLHYMEKAQQTMNHFDEVLSRLSVVGVNYKVFGETSEED